MILLFNQMRYKLINHTADIGIKVRGKTLKELFENAAWSMFDIITDLDKVKARKLFKLNVEADDMDDLLINWLRDLLYKFNGENYLLKEFKVEKIEKSSLKGRIKGEKLNLSYHYLKREIKAVTYNSPKVKKKGEYWEAQIIFDI